MRVVRNHTTVLKTPCLKRPSLVPSTLYVAESAKIYGAEKVLVAKPAVDANELRRSPTPVGDRIKTLPLAYGWIATRAVCVYVGVDRKEFADRDRSCSKDLVQNG